MGTKKQIGTKEAADRIGIDESGVRRYIRLGVLAGEKFGRDWMMAEADVLAFAKSRPLGGFPRGIKPKT